MKTEIARYGKRAALFGVIAFSAILFCTPKGYGVESVTVHQIEQWRIIEISFQSKKFKEDPPLDLIVDVTFSKGEKKIARPAFWDGGSSWKVRFAPTETGAWKYETKCSDPADNGLHAQTGEIKCVAYKGENPNFKHGFLKVAEDRRRLVRADGTRFFWLGDTHWCGPSRERVDVCNHPEHKGGACPHGGQFQHLVQDRKAKGFTVYQLYPDAASASNWKEKFKRVNPIRFQKVMDVMMDYLAEQGFTVTVGLGHWKAPSYMSEADLKRWARYLMARYGAHPILWITSQETDMRTKESKAWLPIAKEIHRLDGYGRPLSYHQRWGAARTWWKEPWHAWGCTQGGHLNVKLRSKGNYYKFWSFKPTKPWQEGEHMYEALKACGGPHPDWVVRRAAWKSQLCGSFGYTYGGAGVWLPAYDLAQVKASRWIDKVWYDGMNLPGSTQMSHLKNFFTSLDDWEQLVPRFNNTNWSALAQAESTVLGTIKNHTYVVYFYGSQTAVTTLKQLQADLAYSAQWFDPSKGVYSDIAKKIKVTDGEWTVPNRPSKADWVLLVRAKSASGNAKSK